MTNPNNAVGTCAAFGGRTSAKAFNDNLEIYLSRGILNGWECVPSSGMTVALGGQGGVRDVAIAEDANGNKTTINNISEDAVEVTIPAAPAANSRIDSIVAYVDNPPEGAATTTDNPSTVGLIVVAGAVASSPLVPDEATIRSAITADGASGSTAYYVVLANVTVASGATTITGDAITGGDVAKVKSQNIDLPSTEITEFTHDNKTWYTYTNAQGKKVFYTRWTISGGPLNNGVAYVKGSTTYPPQVETNDIDKYLLLGSVSTAYGEVLGSLENHALNVPRQISAKIHNTAGTVLQGAVWVNIMLIEM